MSEMKTANRRLSEILTEDMVRHETIKVHTTDGLEHEVEVYALSDADFFKALETSNVDLADIGNRDKLFANMRFARSVANVATRDERIASFLLPNESAKVMMKAFEISGLTTASPSTQPSEEAKVD
jgi:hypothetical protein